MVGVNGLGAKDKSFFAPVSSVVQANKEKISKVMAIVGLVLFVGGMTLFGTRLADGLRGLPSSIKEALIGAGVCIAGEIIGLVGFLNQANIQLEKSEAAAHPKPIDTELTQH
jgi:hypothetical protein